jgi:uncharacterized protein (DUF58 family)
VNAPAAPVPVWRRTAGVLTARGWGLSGVAVLAALAAALVGIEELYAVAAAAAAAVVTAVVWCRARRWRIDVGRQIHPGRVAAGQGASVAISLRNRSARPSPVLGLRDPFGDGRRTTVLIVAPLRPGERRTGTYPLAPAPRGVYRVGPLSLEIVDPLGLARRSRTSTQVSDFVVHPPVERLRAPSPGSGRDRAPGSALPVPGRDNDEFATLREYRPGDDIRRMHWASTARTDTLMVREDQMERRSQVCVVVDVRRPLWAPSSFERALSVAASLVCAALDAGQRARLVTSAGADSGTGSGEAHRTRVLDLLADAGPSDDRIGAATGPQRPTDAPPLPFGGTVIAVTSERADLGELRRFARLGRSVELTLVVIERSSTPSRMTPAGAHRVVRVAPGTDLATAWGRAG